MNKNKSRELSLGMILTLLLLLLAIFSLTSCETTREVHQRKLNNAKNRIDKLILKYPELRSIKDTIQYVHDTTIVNNTHYINDSIYIEGGIRIDTIVHFTNIDSIMSIYSNNIELKLAEMAGGQVRAAVSIKPHYIYEIDTINTVDTIFREKIIKETITTINTEKSFWWSLWFQVKGWLWLILIIILILIIVRVIFKFVG